MKTNTVIRILLACAVRAAKNAIFPSKCFACGTFFQTARNYDSLEEDFQHKQSLIFPQNFSFNEVMHPFLCSDCIANFLPVESPFCSVCGIIVESRHEKTTNYICAECMKYPKKFRIARTVGVYEQPFKTIIHRLKYNDKIQLAKPLGMLLFSFFVNLWNVNSIDIIMPVPLHTKRLKDRGFNQAFLLIKNWRHFAENLNINPPQFQIEKNILTKSKWTESQTNLSRKERTINVKNAFSVNNRSKIKGKKILLVDDVYTTGATVNECAQVLLDNGAMHVDVLTLARTML